MSYPISMHYFVEPMVVEEVLFPWLISQNGLTESLNYSEIKNNDLSLMSESVILIGTFIIKVKNTEINQGFYAEILSHNLVFQKNIHFEAVNRNSEFIALSFLHSRKLIDIIEIFDFSLLHINGL